MKQGFVNFLELLDRLFLPAKYLNDLLAMNNLLNIAIQCANGFLLEEEVLGG